MEVSKQKNFFQSFRVQEKAVSKHIRKCNIFSKNVVGKLMP